MRCKINNELIFTCDYCELLSNGCDGLEEPIVCDVCGAVIIASLIIEHKSICHGHA